MGIGVGGGAEKVAHLAVLQLVARQLQGPNPPNLVIQTVDFTNAFNCISRTAVATEVDTVAPELSRYYRWSYGVRLPLVANGQRVGQASRGVGRVTLLLPPFLR